MKESGVVLAAMEQPFGPLLLEEEMPPKGHPHQYHPHPRGPRPRAHVWGFPQPFSGYTDTAENDQTANITNAFSSPQYEPDEKKACMPPNGSKVKQRGVGC